MAVRRQIWITSFILYGLSQLFFLIYVQFPLKYSFDEAHYIPVVRRLLEREEPKNWEHPPLGKLLMTVGVAVGGDRPFGWRLMSTVFGALTLVGMYLMGWVLFGKQSTALWIALITLFNQLLYVQARIGMLDTFMFCFLIWGLTAFTTTWAPRWTRPQSLRLLFFAGACFGLAMACKWFSLIPWFGCLGWVVLVKVLQTVDFQISSHPPTHLPQEAWYRKNLWKKVSMLEFFVLLFLVPVVFYYLTFIPYCFLKDVPCSFYSVVVLMQKRMWSDQLRVVSSHPYMSQWLDWPLLGRPIWYAFEREPTNDAFVRGVLLLGNPLIMWSGLLALIACFWDGIRTQRMNALFICYFYLICYVCWYFIPRKILFYYYYYPSGMLLSFALAYIFHYDELKGGKYRAWLKWVYFSGVFLLFLYFFPILAGLKIPTLSFRAWMWFKSWV